MVNNNHLLKPMTVYSIFPSRGYIIINNEKYGYKLDTRNIDLESDIDAIKTHTKPNMVSKYPLTNPVCLIKIDILNKLELIIEDDNTFNRLFSTTIIKDLFKNITPTVKDIILSDVWNSWRYCKELHSVRIALISYFLKECGNGRDTKDIKLQEYVNFIRLHRNKFFNVNFKVGTRKFISNAKRSTTLLEYENMIGNNHEEN